MGNNRYRYINIFICAGSTPVLRCKVLITFFLLSLLFCSIEIGFPHFPVVEATQLTKDMGTLMNQSFGSDIAMKCTYPYHSIRPFRSPRIEYI